MILIYITNPTEKEAERIAGHLLGKRLIACANIFPIKSVFRWKGKAVKKKEFVLIAKARAGNFGKVKTEVERIHPYSVPCVIKIPVEANNKYLDWVKEETKL